MKIRLWSRKFIKVKRLRKQFKKQLGGSNADFRNFILMLENMKIIRTHFSGFGSEKRNEDSYGSHEKVISVLDKEKFLDYYYSYKHETK